MKITITLYSVLCLLLLVSLPSYADHQKIEIKAGSLVYQGTGFREFNTDALALFSTRGKARDKATISSLVPIGNSRFNIKLHTIGENIGQSSYRVHIGDQLIGEYTAPKTTKRYDSSADFVTTFKNIAINEGELFSVTAINHSADDKNFTRGIWSKIEFVQLDHDPGKNNSMSKYIQSQFRTQSQIESGPDLVQPRQQDGNAKVILSGELKQWHNVVLTMDGPFAHEQDISPNPFLDYRMSVTFSHQSGVPTYTVPGYFSTDGNAAETSAESGNKWRAHLSPDKPGEWSYRVSFVKGEDAAINPSVGNYLAPYQGLHGNFTVAKTNKTGADFRGKGRLEYIGGHYLRHAGTGQYFIKAGPDAPETMLAYVDIDNTINAKAKLPLKTWQPHAQDAKADDPVWQGGKGKNLLGALNYLAEKDVNAFSFLTYNAAGDGDNIWPYVERNGKYHFDTSKLDQWDIIFSHAQKLGLYLHFKLQENENDDNRKGARKLTSQIKESLDGGLLGKERKLYLRELIARYSHHLALNWNLGEENTQSYEEQRNMAEYVLNVDPYDHNIVIHSFPSQQDKVYQSLLGSQSVLTGASLQNSWRAVHKQTLRWVNASRAAGKPWIVANDEQNPAGMGVPPDPGYKGFDGWAKDRKGKFNLHDIRKQTLWGNIMAGGAGVEYYFGYRLAENDLLAEDFRSRDRSWDYAGFALQFFEKHSIPVHRMQNMNHLVMTKKTVAQISEPIAESANLAETDKVATSVSPYVLANKGEIYLIYLHQTASVSLDLTADKGTYNIKWFNPRTGGDLHQGTITKVNAGKWVNIGLPPHTSTSNEDWLAVLRQL